MTVIIDGGAGVTFPDTVQQTNAVTNTGGAPRYYAARAWVNFDGSLTAVIRSSANVSSITDNGTGNYTVNFASPMPDANYAVYISWQFNSQGEMPGTNNMTVNGYTVQCRNVGGSAVDTAVCTSGVFR